MAKKTTVVLEDDITGEPAAEAVEFGLDGTTYDIDLSADNAARLRGALAEFVSHGRRRTARRPAAGPFARGTGNSSDVDPARIRQWARDNGLVIASRGRVPAGVAEAYKANDVSAARAALDKVAANRASVPAGDPGAHIRQGFEHAATTYGGDGMPERVQGSETLASAAPFLSDARG